MAQSVPVFLAVSILFLTGVCHAGPYLSVQQTNYEFSYDSMAKEEGPRRMFVICDQCPGKDVLTVAIKPSPPVALKFSEDIKEPQEKTPPQHHAVTVYFGKGRCAVSKEDRQKLSAFSHAAKKVISAGRIADVRVRGYTCDIGSKKTNDTLAHQRAHAVARELEKDGIIPKSVTGYGKCCYLVTGKSEKYLNRRVEVDIPG